ncbi:MAG: hypothetical protein JXX14_14640 [Deltaproteobacteria bacterium]|nr:hypothetical protein [Deltaproteobacteria bacterium]
MIKRAIILMFGFGLLIAGCEFRELVADFDSTDSSSDTATADGATEAPDVPTDTEPPTDTATETESQTTDSVTSDETAIPVDTRQLKIEQLPVKMDICSARVSRAVNPRPGEWYNPLQLNHDMGGYTFVGASGFGVSPYNVAEQEQFVATNVAGFKPLHANSSDGLVYGLGAMDGNPDHVTNVVAISMEDGTTSWSMPFQKRLNYEFDYDGSGEANQAPVAVSHPNGGVIIVSAFNDVLVLNNGDPTETRLETSGSNYATFMAHYSTDGAVISARVLDMKIVPKDIRILEREGVSVIIVAGSDNTKIFEPAGMAMLSLDGDLIWETSNTYYPEDEPVFFSMIESARIIPGPSETFYLALDTWENMAFKGTDGNVLETGQPGFIKETSTGTTGDSHAIALAQYDMDGRIVSVTLPKVGPYDMDTYPADVIFQNNLLLIMGRQQTDNIIGDSRTVAEEITGISDLRYFIAAFSPDDMALQGVLLLPEPMVQGTLQPRDDISSAALAYGRISETMLLDKPVAQYPGDLNDELIFDSALEGNVMGVIMEICHVNQGIE